MAGTLAVPGGWSDRMLAGIKAAGQSKSKPYVFLTSCVDAVGEDIDALVRDSEDATLAEVKHNCDIDAFKRTLGYSMVTGDDLLTLEDDWHVGYARSVYRGIACYFINHSGIEYIWVNTRGEAA